MTPRADELATRQPAAGRSGGSVVVVVVLVEVVVVVAVSWVYT
jgi:CHASE3 domain sensor protein